ncbi:MAG: RpiB/LacA/LacB family sugar-phosphate isomerase [Streptococcaceae bacterium]|jgi:ribose 5-phosphate isomerase RpiB|nr:RpiB/LacA/LacB family sugar-phosphate isomerase [Streptococcaceae bacterium]
MKIAFVTGSSIVEGAVAAFEILRELSEKYGHMLVDYRAKEPRSYVNSAILAGKLLNEGEADFVIGGCSSGLGFQLALNTCPNVLCGYGTTPIEAALFARINKGNAFSYPFALNWGWAAEENFRFVIAALFQGMTEEIYPAKEAARKKSENESLKKLSQLSKVSYENWLKKVEKL